MNRVFGKETEVIAAGTFHTAKGENDMSSFNKETEVIPSGTFHKAKGGKKMRNIINIHKEASTKKYILSPDHCRVLVTSGGAKIDRR